MITRMGPETHTGLYRMDIMMLFVETLKVNVSVQTVNILMVNQSIIDMCASFLTLLTAVVEVDGTGMSRDSVWNQFVCRMWLTRSPLWAVLNVSTYNIFLTAIERYTAVIYPIWYKNSVRTVRLYMYIFKNK